MEQLKNEIWKPTFVNPYYLVSNKGRIRTLDRPVWCAANQSYSIRKGKILTANNQNTKRYWRIAIPSETGNKASRKIYSIHRLVATAFLPNPNNLPQINHIDGNKDNNCVENLEWCDNGYNQRHAAEHGLKDRSKMSAHSSFRKLSQEQVCFIKYIYSTINANKYGEKARCYKTLKQMFKLQSENTIHWITSGGTNKFFNQDIVQTPNFDTYLSEFNRLYDANRPERTIKSYAEELGVNVSSFRTRYRMFNKDLFATINYFRQLDQMQ